jgi:hypothetical protein
VDTAETSAPFSQAGAPVVQRTKAAGSKPTVAGKTAKAKSGGSEPAKPPRYPGHDSAVNKRALLAVARHRNQTLKLELSQPESVALANNAHGTKNVTALMPLGTAICHKMSASWLAEQVMQHCKKPTPAAFMAFAASCISAITPQATDQCPGAGTEYHGKALADLAGATSHAHTAASNWHSPAHRYEFAHHFARCVAQSPVNLFIGDSATNSAIGAEGDSNRYRNRCRSPRSRRSRQTAGKRNAKGKEMSSAMPGQ